MKATKHRFWVVLVFPAALCAFHGQSRAMWGQVSNLPGVARASSKLAPTAEPYRSGLAVGQRPGPYAAVVATGALRGESHCFICETADRPAVIVFARTMSEPLGKLAHQLDGALNQYKTAELRAWITFLSDDQTSLDPKVVQWGQKHATGTLPLAVFEDVDGPPAYRLAKDADVTILLSTRQCVVANFAFRAGELTEDRANEVLRALAQAVDSKPGGGVNPR